MRSRISNVEGKERVMSAGDFPNAPTPDADLSKLAPQFRTAVIAALAECSASGYDAYVYEACRSDALQKVYYARGRTIIPPTTPVTNANDASYSWHGYAMAADIISRSKQWDVPYEWFASVAAIFKKHGCNWGGDWKKPDYPHFQFGTLRPSPSIMARELYHQGNIQKIWSIAGAL